MGGGAGRIAAPPRCKRLEENAMAMSLDAAKDERFARSTLDELRSFCNDLGIEYSPKNKGDHLRTKLMNALGVAEAFVTASGKPREFVRPAKDILPPYNLTLSGWWEGRRHRVRLSRPPGTSIANGEGFFLGPAQQFIEYNEVRSVPEWTYCQMVDKQTARRTQKSMRNNDGDKTGEVMVEWEFEQAPFTYLGVDPETADRCGSLHEWYQNKGTKWLDELTLRQLQSVAAILDVQSTERSPAGVPVHLPIDRLLEAVKLRLFSFHDIEVAAAA